MEYISKISGSSDRKGSIIEILSQLGASFQVQQFEDVENIVVSFHPGDKRLVIGAHWDADEGSDGANDNASGTGAILYLAKLFAKAVRDGILPRPERTIRFMMGDECWGSMGYLACHPENAHLCGIVGDMIGTETGDRAELALCYDPVSNAHPYFYRKVHHPSCLRLLPHPFELRSFSCFLLRRLYLLR